MGWDVIRVVLGWDVIRVVLLLTLSGLVLWWFSFEPPPAPAESEATQVEPTVGCQEVALGSQGARVVLPPSLDLTVSCDQTTEAAQENERAVVLRGIGVCTFCYEEKKPLAVGAAER